VCTHVCAVWLVHTVLLLLLLLLLLLPLLTVSVACLVVPCDSHICRHQCQQMNMNERHACLSLSATVFSLIWSRLNSDCLTSVKNTPAVILRHRCITVFGVCFSGLVCWIYCRLGPLLWGQTFTARDYRWEAQLCCAVLHPETSDWFNNMSLWKETK